jgi:uncharacterized damage-inducible protein DinB
MKRIVHYNLEQLGHLETLIQNLDETTYAAPVPLLHNNSLGKHCRHMLEFYVCFLKGVLEGTINYDKRERNLLLENSHTYALATLETLRRALQTFANENLAETKLMVEASDVAPEPMVLASTLERELVYLADHTVHHLALVRLGFEALLPTKKLDATLGVAPSTIKSQPHVYTNVSA